MLTFISVTLTSNANAHHLKLNCSIRKYVMQQHSNIHILVTLLHLRWTTYPRELHASDCSVAKWKQENSVAPVNKCTPIQCSVFNNRGHCPIGRMSKESSIQNPESTLISITLFYFDPAGVQCMRGYIQARRLQNDATSDLSLHHSKMTLKFSVLMWHVYFIIF